MKGSKTVPNWFLTVNKEFWDHLGGGRPPGPFLTTPGEWLGVEGGLGPKKRRKKIQNPPKLIFDSKLIIRPQMNNKYVTYSRTHRGEEESSRLGRNGMAQIGLEAALGTVLGLRGRLRGRTHVMTKIGRWVAWNTRQESTWGIWSMGNWKINLKWGIMHVLYCSLLFVKLRERKNIWNEGDGWGNREKGQMEQWRHLTWFVIYCLASYISA